MGRWRPPILVGSPLLQLNIGPEPPFLYYLRMQTRTLSTRISAVAPSATLALNAKAQTLAKSGIKVFNFTVGEPDYPTPRIVTEKAIQSLNSGRTKYGPAGGGLPLRESIVAKLKRDNRLDFSVDQIVCGIGAKEILFHIFLSLLNDGDEAILTAPFWVSYADQIKAAGASPIIVPIPEDLNKPILNLDVIRKYESPRTKVFVLNSPNNPAGYVLTKSELIDLGNYLKTKNWWIVSDEIYEYMAFDHPHFSLLEFFPELKDRFIYVNGLSKSFAMTGWRVGYCAAPKEVASMVRNLQSHSSTCLPGFIEDAGVLALQGGKDLMQSEIQSLIRRRDQTMKLIGSKFSYVRPQGAFYIFADIRKFLKPGESSLKFCERILDEQHIALVPGEAFGSPGFVRFSYAQSEEILHAGVSKFLGAL